MKIFNTTFGDLPALCYNIQMVGLERNDMQQIPMLDGDDPQQKWWAQLVEYGVYSLLGLFGALVSVALLSLNLLPMRTGRWRQRWIIAVVGLAGFNSIAVHDVMRAVKNMEYKEKDYSSSVGASLFLLAVRTTCAIIADLLFIGLIKQQSQFLQKKGRNNTLTQSAATPNTADTASIRQRVRAEEDSVEREAENRLQTSDSGLQLAGPETNFADRMDPMRDESRVTIYERDPSSLSQGGCENSNCYD